MTICAASDCDHYGCQLRRKGIRLSSSATPTMRNAVAPRTPDPAWERGIAVDRRPRGEVMPLLDAGATRVIRQKEYGERRHEIEAQLKRLKGPVN